jgi:RHS repeat-associated protein
VTDSYEYDAFGNKINSTGTTPNNYLYRGEQYDSDLGLYYLRARYYNPNTGRFMSRDPEAGKPIDPKTLHKYLYASGDPVNGLDPTGRDSIIDYAISIGDSSEAVQSELYLSRKMVEVDICIADILAGFSDTLLSWSRILEYCGGIL